MNNIKTLSIAAAIITMGIASTAGASSGHDIVLCNINYGDKGTYPTLFKLEYETKNHYIVRSDGGILVEATQRNITQLNKMPKSSCKKIPRNH